MPMPPPPDLRIALRRLLDQVPRGHVTTFGRLAEALGDVVAARWVADFLWNDPTASDWPSHRVVLRDGFLGGTNADRVVAQERTLTAEGVLVEELRVDLSQYVWSDFQTDRPLAVLRDLQDALGREHTLPAVRERPRWIGGVDLSYRNDWSGVSAFALVDGDSGELAWSTTISCAVQFPYITGYLSFREIPVHDVSLAAARTAGKLPDVLLVDGSGILHPRGMGVASHLGVVTGLRTVGVSKKLLCGDVNLNGLGVDEVRPVLIRGETRGWALRPRESGRPIFVSPGHGCDVAYALQAVQRVLLGRKLPEPIRWADRLSRDAVREQQ
jgi:deoxyribonuclease V